MLPTYLFTDYLIFSVQIELKPLTKVQHGLQKMCQVSQDCLPSWRNKMPGQIMAQSMFQMRSLQHDVKHEKLQGFRQKAILWSVSV